MGGCCISSEGINSPRRSSSKRLNKSEKSLYIRDHIANDTRETANQVCMTDYQITQLLSSDNSLAALGQLISRYRFKVKMRANVCKKCQKVFRSSTTQFDCEQSICRKCSRLPSPEESSSTTNSRSYMYEESKSSEATFDCQLCYTSYSMSLAVTLNCDHRFCRGCMEGYLTEVIKSNSYNSKDLNCPTFECKSAIDVYIMKALLDENLFMLYDNFRARLYSVESGLSLR